MITRSVLAGTAFTPFGRRVTILRMEGFVGTSWILRYVTTGEACVLAV